MLQIFNADDERGKKGKGRGEKERVTKDEDEMQMISNGIAVLHSLFLHSSTPHLIPPSTLLLPEAHHHHHQKSPPPLSLCLCLCLCLFEKKLQTSSSQAMQEIG
jgi:hypothetical protein